MQNILRKILIIGIVLIMCAGILCACNNGSNSDISDESNSNIYEGVTIFDHAETWLNDTYLESHKTRGMQYDDGYLNNDAYPKYYEDTVKDAEAFNQTFKTFPAEIGFDNQVICLYMYTSYYMGRNYKITNMQIIEGCLNIDIKSVRQNQNEFIGDASIPMQRCIAVVVPNIDFETVNFNIEN